MSLKEKANAVVANLMGRVSNVQHGSFWDKVFRAREVQ